MMHRPSRAGFIVGAATLLVAAACGSTTAAPGTGSDNGIAGKNVADIQTQVNAAIKNQKTVQADGAGSLSGKPATITFKIDFPNQKIDAAFNLTAGGSMTMQITGGHIYATLDKAIAAAFGGGAGSSATDALAGKCIDFGSTSDSSNPLSSSMGSLGNFGSGDLFSGKTFAKGTVKTVNGVEVLPLTTATGDELDIATHGDALPIQFITKSGSDPLTLTFKNWGNAVTVNPPSNCLTLAQIEAQMLQGAGGTPSADTSGAVPTDTSGASPSPS